MIDRGVCQPLPISSKISNKNNRIKIHALAKESNYLNTILNVTNI